MPPSPESAPPADRPPARVAPAAIHIAIAALAVSVVAFLLYHATLLPGVDFGDSGSFQTTVGSLPRPRDGYPLYFAIGWLVLWLTRVEPAHALNLASSLEAALACGLFVVVATELGGSIAAAMSGALLLAVSYTFWSQAVTAEVYALHLALVLATVLFLLRWERRPTLGRLAAFFGCYALSFGNHLSMILAAPAFIAFLCFTAPRRWRSLFEPRVLALAAGLAALGALQYAWNLRTAWFLPDPPASLWDAIAAFWFDVTKSDWRDTMVLQVPRVMRASRTAMYWFDLRQQFGAAGVALAAIGAVALAAKSRSRAALLILIYLANVAFAFGYNVGDTHVFYLPSHLIVALLAAVAVASLSWSRRLPRWAAPAAAVLLAAYAGFRGYRDYPALDRSRDLRAREILESLTDGIDDRRSILLVDLNWQVANGLSYFAKSVRPEVAVARARDVLLYAPVLIGDNVESQRTVAMNDRAFRIVFDSYGDLYPATPAPGERDLGTLVAKVPPGTRYALCLLKPTSDFPFDRDGLDRALRALSPTATVSVPQGDYAVIAGVAGQLPALATGSNSPFVVDVNLDGVPVEVRMESWLDFDTIRRMGFGHVIAARQHTLIVERGVSFVAFDGNGVPVQTGYSASVFEPQRRYFIAPP